MLGKAAGEGLNESDELDKPKLYERFPSTQRQILKSYRRASCDWKHI